MPGNQQLSDQKLFLSRLLGSEVFRLASRDNLFSKDDVPLFNEPVSLIMGSEIFEVLKNFILGPDLLSSTFVDFFSYWGNRAPAFEITYFFPSSVRKFLHFLHFSE